MLLRAQNRRQFQSVRSPLLPFVCGAALAAFCLPNVALAQASGQVAQPLPSRDSLELSAVLSRLSREPRNVDALVDAGIAASKLGDFEAAVGFFRRGQALAPTNSRLLAGLAGALVRQGDAASAVPLFAQAQAAGAPAQAIAADRGLAHDLIGDPVGAQRFYAQALAAGSDVEEVTRRLAISQAIAGDGEAMEKTLLPLLKKQDKPAWRARAFGLAILGQDKEASRIVKTLLPGRLADGITPYLQYMPRLTRAQQAAAANLGIFPRASEIGRDETRLAALSSGREAGRALVPAGRPLGPGESKAATVSPREARKRAEEAETRARRDAKLAAEQRKREARVAESERRERRIAPPEPRPTRDDAGSTDSDFAVPREAPVPKVAEIMSGRTPQESPSTTAPPTRLAQVASAQVSPTPATTTQPTPAPAPSPVASTPVEVSGPAVARSPAPAPAAAAKPGFDLARLPTSTASTSVPGGAAAPESKLTPAQASAPAPVAAEPGSAHSFGALFADFDKPTTVVDPAAGSVDIRKIEPARPKPKPKPEPRAEAKKAAPSHPSRIWVQLGIGQRIAALSYDWRRLEKANASLFKGRRPYSARLNGTNRLLTGPFASRKEASTFIDALKKAGISGPYMWISPAGEVVDDLSR